MDRLPPRRILRSLARGIRAWVTRAADDSGQAVVLAAALMTAMCGVGAITVDIGLLVHERVAVQNAVEAGALAGAQLLPSDAVNSEVVAREYVLDNEPALPPGNLAVSFRCVVGDRDFDGLPDLSDIPLACNPGGNASWTTAGGISATLCLPAEGDTCNVIVVQASTDVPFSFAGVLGIPMGSTGVRTSAACRGVCGGPPTGPLNVLSSFIGESERIVTIEDPLELQLQQPHVVSLEARPASIEGTRQITQRDLLRNALRMRPDRVIVGEVRGGEAFDMLQAMNTGHDGSIGTVHANSPRDALSRVENMVLMAGLDLPDTAVREQIASAVQLLVQITRMPDGSRRVTHITEVAGMEGHMVTLQDLFLFEADGRAEDGRIEGALVATGLQPHFVDRFDRAGVPFPTHLLRTSRWEPA